MKKKLGVYPPNKLSEITGSWIFIIFFSLLYLTQKNREILEKMMKNKRQKTIKKTVKKHLKDDIKMFKEEEKEDKELLKKMNKGKK